MRLVTALIVVHIRVGLEILYRPLLINSKDEKRVTDMIPTRKTIESKPVIQ